jgi:hypothetical protein
MQRRAMLLLSLGLAAATAGLAGPPAVAQLARTPPSPIRSALFLPASLPIVDPVDGPVLLTGGFALGTQVAVPPNPIAPPVESVVLAGLLIGRGAVSGALYAAVLPPTPFITEFVPLSPFSAPFIMQLWRTTPPNPVIPPDPIRSIPGTLTVVLDASGKPAAGTGVNLGPHNF